MQNEAARLVRRDTNEKVDIKWADMATEVPKMLDAIVRVDKWEEVTPALNQRKLVLAPWCEDPETEKQMKKKSNEEAIELQTDDPTALTGAMKSLCIPLKSAAG